MWWCRVVVFVVSVGVGVGVVFVVVVSVGVGVGIGVGVGVGVGMGVDVGVGVGVGFVFVLLLLLLLLLFVAVDYVGANRAAPPPPPPPPFNHGVRMRVMESSIKTVEINFLCVHKKLRAKRLAPVLIKEVTRRVNRSGVWQVNILFSDFVLFSDFRVPISDFRFLCALEFFPWRKKDIRGFSKSERKKRNDRIGTQNVLGHAGLSTQKTSGPILHIRTAQAGSFFFWDENLQNLKLGSGPGRTRPWREIGGMSAGVLGIYLPARSSPPPVPPFLRPFFAPPFTPPPPLSPPTCSIPRWL